MRTHTHARARTRTRTHAHAHAHSPPPFAHSSPLDVVCLPRPRSSSPLLPPPPHSSFFVGPLNDNALITWAKGPAPPVEKKHTKRDVTKICFQLARAYERGKGRGGRRREGGGEEEGGVGRAKPAIARQSTRTRHHTMCDGLLGTGPSKPLVETSRQKQIVESCVRTLLPKCRYRSMWSLCESVCVCVSWTVRRGVVEI